MLEPSAGLGALAIEAFRQGASEVECIELNVRCCEQLRAKLCGLGADYAMRVRAYQADFTLAAPERFLPFDRIVMNPPFSNGQDVAHVTRAFFSWLAPGGRLVAIMSAGVAFRQDEKTKSFRALVQRQGTMEDLPEGSFHESGTDVRCVLVTMTRGG